MGESVRRFKLVVSAAAAAWTANRGFTDASAGSA